MSKPVNPQHKEIKTLIALLKESNIAEIEVTSPQGGSVRVRQHAPSSVAIPAPLTTTHLTSPQTSVAKGQDKTKPVQEKGHTVRTPLIGTAYLAPSPAADPFVQVGSRVAIGDTLCLIEAMKTFNKIEADVAGLIKTCLIKDGQPVEYDQPLFIIDTGEG